MPIYPQPHGKFRVAVYNNDTKKLRTKLCKTEAEANRVEQQFIDEIRKGTYVEDGLSKKKTLNDICDLYEADFTISDKEMHYINEVRRMFGDIKLNKLTTETIQTEYDNELERGLKPSSVLKKFKTLRKLIKWVLTKNGYHLAKLPTDGVVIEFEDDTRDRRLLPIEEEYIIEALKEEHTRAYNEEFRCLFTLLLETAMRLGEALKMTWHMVDLPNRTIRLSPKIIKTRPVGGRNVPLTTVAVSILKELEKMKVKDNDFVFKGIWSNSSACSYRFRRNVLPKARKLYLCHCRKTKTFPEKHHGVRLFKNLHIHDLRHEAICRLFLRTKLTDIQIMKISGHKDPKSLLRYSSLRPSELVEQLW